MEARRTKFQTMINDSLRTGTVPEDYPPHDLDLPEDLDALCAAFETLRTWELPRQSAILPALCNLTYWVRTERQKVVILDHVMEPLLEMAQRMIAWPSSDPQAVLAALEVLVNYGNSQGEELLVKLARQGYSASKIAWFDALRFCDNHVLLEIANPLPPEPICTQLLMACTRRFEDGESWHHPFETPQGRQKLAEYLRGHQPQDESVAVNVAMALGGFHDKDDALLALAASHKSPRVRVEAAGSMAVFGERDGIQLLGQLTADPSVSNIACRYLEQKGCEDAISPVAEEEEFMATADLYEWLSQEEQRGRAPDNVELVDTRQVYWPPLEEDRVLWLFRFTYISPLDQQPQDYLALVGGIGPHSFFQAEMLDWPLDDLYAYHCSWEWFYAEDACVDESKCSIEHGRDLLAKGPQEPAEPEENDDF